MLVAGVLGGFVNYYLNYREGAAYVQLKKSVVVGVGASFVVPVFLSMVSSDVISASRDDPYRLFFFFGLCVLAAISSRAFIKSLSERVLKELKEEVDEVKEEIAPLVEKETEEDSEESEFVSDDAPSDARAVDILRPLVKSQYTLRSLVGIASETKLPPNEVRKVLDDVTVKGYAVQTTGKRGLRWYITKKGKRYLKSQPGLEE
jgi:hypothetical protein